MVRLSAHDNEFDCTHDPAHQDHLVCVKKRRSVIENPFLLYFFDRYHRHYHRRHVHGKKHFIADISLLSCAIVLLSFNIYNAILIPTLFPHIIDLTVTTDGPEFFSGREKAFTITLANNSRSDMEEVRLRLHPSKTFRITELSGASINSFGTTVYLGDLPKRARRIARVTGIPFNALGSHDAFGITLEYGLIGSRDKKSQESRFLYAISGSIYTLDPILPARITANQRFEGTATITPEIFSAANGNLTLTAPPPFRLDSLGSQNTLSVPIKFNTPTSISVKGKFVADASGAQNLHFKLTARHGTTDILQAEKIVTVEVLKPAVELELTPLDKESALQPDAEARYRLSWKHGGTLPAKNVTVGVKISGDFADLKNLESDDGVVTRTGSVVWTKNHKKSLGQFSENGHGAGEFSFRVKPRLDLSNFAADHDFRVRLQPFASYTIDEDEKGESFGTPVYAEVATALTASAAARYWTPEGEQIGRGPLPPRVGKLTRYPIVFAVQSGIHPASTAVLTAKLGKGVTLGSLQSGAGSLSISPDRQTISWNIGALPAILGVPNPLLRSTLFELGILPTPDMAGTDSTLLKDILLTARDSVSDTNITVHLPPVTTFLGADQRASGKSRVRP